MLTDVLAWVAVFVVGGLLTAAAGLTFVYFFWAIQENEADRNRQDSVRKDKGDSWQ